MPRVSRNYQHQDFSYLLAPQEAEAKPVAKTKTKNKKQPPVITPEKRRRDSLMANRNMRYVLSPEGLIHDRDCTHAARIPDSAFDMCEDFPNGRASCPACCRRAMIRKGLDLNLTKYMTAALRVFNRINATNSDLDTLFMVHRAQIDRVEADGVYLKVREDRWLVRIAEKGCMLYHNNYQTYNETQRLMEDGFHLQYIYSMSFRAAVQTMTKYTWDGHMRLMEARQKELRQAVLRQKLSFVCNYQPVRRFSVFYRYFRVADFNYHLQQQRLPIHILNVEVHEDDCMLLLCRIPRWKAKLLPEAAEGIKKHCVEQEHSAYADFCLHRLSA